MADWYGQARSNFVKVSDIDGLRESLKDVDIDVEQHPEHKDYYAFFSSDQFGGWPSFIGDGDEEFSFETMVCPYIAEDEVLICNECGAEKTNYLSGRSSAYIRRGDQIRFTEISISDIYRLAAEKFGVSHRSIAECSYLNISSEAQEMIRSALPVHKM